MKKLAARRITIQTPKGHTTVYSGRCAGGNFHGPLFDGDEGQVLLIAADDTVLAAAWREIFGVDIDPAMVYDASAIGTKPLDLILPVDVESGVPCHKETRS